MSKAEGRIGVEVLEQFPERPESEFEWEDLLLRLEIMPRALRVELERTRPEQVPPILESLIERESTVQRLLEEVAIADESQPDSAGVSTGPEAFPTGSRDGSVPGSPGTADVERFVRLRGRNFAMLQRRGIDVWNWRVRLSGTAAATVFQLLSLLAQEDVQTLSRLRNARRPAVDAC